MASILKNILVLLSLLFVLAFGYYLYVQNGSASLDTGTSQVSLDVQAEASAFLVKLAELKAINLDNSIFMDPRFMYLVQYSTEVEPELFGLENPFSTDKENDQN